MIKECCRNPENLKDVPTDNPNLTMKKCQVCGCRHFRAIAEPSFHGIKPAELGKKPEEP